MREIKFRAWVNGGMEIYTLRPFAGITETSLFLGVCSDEPIPIMQFTGLTDAKGKEIYEGDILKSNRADDKKSEVYWREEVAGFEFVATDGSGDSWMPNSDAVGYSWEIVGNIYEHPHLVEDSNRSQSKPKEGGS